MWRASGLLVTFLCAATARAQQPAEPMGPAAPASVDELAHLRDEVHAAEAAAAARLGRQEAELVRLRRALDEERAQRAADATAARVLADEARRKAEDPSLIRSARFGLTLSGFVQADAVAWRQSSQDQINDSTGDPLNETRFLIRRARLRAELEWRWVAGALELDGNTVKGPQARLIGAEASFVWRNPAAPRLPWLQLTLGLFKTPFGFEVLQSDRDRLFLERSNAERALFPGEYDLGARLQGGWRFLRYALGVMNGDPVGEKAFPGRDPTESKDVVGRLGVDLAVLRRLGLRAGFSALYGNGFHRGTAASKDTLVWRDTNEDGAVQLSEIGVIVGATAQPSKTFSRYALGGDLELVLAVPRLGDLMLYAEVVWASNLDRATVIADPVAPPGRDWRELGVYVAATQELTRWAMIGLRYDVYDPDRDANDRAGGVQVPRDARYSTLAVAAALQYPPWGRLVLEYDHNTNPLGRSATGAVVTLPDDALTLRGQVAF
jgi:hypothetical protein